MACLRGGVVVLVLTSVSACGGDDPAGAADATTPPAPDAGPPPSSDPLYDPDRLVEIAFTMDDADWQEMRRETRPFLDQLQGDCTAQPFPKPFNWYQADITIDGETVAQIGVHKKGFLGSLEVERPGLKVKFDHFVAGQEYLGLERMTLNNVRQDPTLVRTCLAYQTFRDAGMPAPRCNYATVSVNGEDLGVYVNVETLDAEFLARHFADPGGVLYEGTLSDFREEFVPTFEIETNELTADRAPLEAVADALLVPDSQLAAALEPLVDLDAFYSFWALEVITGHWDGYAANTNNFYVYADPSDGRLRFLPWGPDAAFQSATTFAGNVSVAALGELARRLYGNPPTRDAYLARVAELLDAVFDEDALLGEVDRMEDLLPAGATSGLDDVRAFIMTRRQAILDEIAAGPAVWTAPRRDALCMSPIGSASGTFTTTFGTNGAPNPFATGSGTFTLVLDGQTRTLTPVGVTAGWEDNPPPGEEPRAVWNVIAALGDGSYEVLVFLVDPLLFQPDTIVIDLRTAIGVVYNFVPGGGASMDGFLTNGEGFLRLDSAATTAGAEVTGSFELEIVPNPFGG